LVEAVAVTLLLLLLQVEDATTFMTNVEGVVGPTLDHDLAARDRAKYKTSIIINACKPR
jgi:hypothetical protein